MHRVGVIKPGQETRSHMLQLKIPHATTKTQCSQINRLLFKNKKQNQANKILECYPSREEVPRLDGASPWTPPFPLLRCVWNSAFSRRDGKFPEGSILLVSLSCLSWDLTGHQERGHHRWLLGDYLGVSDSLWPCGLEPTRIFLSWDSPGKNTGVGSHSLLQGSSWPRDGTQVSYISCIGRQILYRLSYLGSPITGYLMDTLKGLEAPAPSPKGWICCNCCLLCPPPLISPWSLPWKSLPSPPQGAHFIS